MVMVILHTPLLSSGVWLDYSNWTFISSSIIYVYVSALKHCNLGSLCCET